MSFFKPRANKSSGYASVDAIRERLENMDYEPVQDVARLRCAVGSAAASNAIEDLIRSDEEIAFDEMMIDMRVPPGPVWRQANDWLASFMLSAA